jgi:arylsulfatase A-like enzyme
MKTKPDILIFCVDQMQSFALGCNGHPDVKTPNLDRMAAEGCTFRRAYCNNTVCMPARATMITGLLPRQHGCITNGTRLPESIPTLPQVLARHGYRTHSVGKLHFQPYDDPGSAECRAAWDAGELMTLPVNYYGFQSSDFLGGHVHYCFGDYRRWLDREAPGTHARYAKANAPWSSSGQEHTWKIDMPEGLHYNDWIAQHSIEFMQKQPDGQPFFLWCSFPDPHHPFAAAAPYNEMYDPAELTRPETAALDADGLPELEMRRKQFAGRFSFTEQGLREAMAQTYGMISHVDACIGRVLEHLRSSGRIENTIVIFVADHGEYLGAHHLLYKAEWMVEELARIPMIWRVPDGASTGAGNDAVVSQVDLVPTLLDYAGIDPAEMDMRGNTKAERCTLPGRSLRPLLDQGASLPPQPALIEYDEDGIKGPFFRVRTLVEERFKLVVYTSPDGGQLFDLQSDLHELSNLWDDPAFAAVKAELMEQALRGFCRNDRLDQLRRSGA